jgi:uncharacterized protein
VKKLGAAALRIILMTSAGLLIYVKIFEHRLIFFPDQETAGMPAAPFEDVFFDAVDGTHLHGWWLPRPGAAGALILSHGNAGNISHRAVAGDFLREELGVNVLMYDYRGYGRSDGSPSEEGTYSDIRGAYSHVQSRGFKPESIILMGQSLGTAVTMDLAADENVGGVILEAPFTSVAGMARRFWWSLPVRSLLSTKYDSLSKISRVKSPIVFVHATGDPVVPYALGRELFEAANAPKQFFEVPADLHEGATMGLGLEAVKQLKALLNSSSEPPKPEPLP